MNATSFVFGVLLTCLTVMVGDVVWTLTMTTNPDHLGGWLIFGYVTALPAMMFLVGYCYPREDVESGEHIVMIGETYYRQ